MRLPSITKIARVTRATIYNKLCSLHPDAQVRVRLEPTHWSTKQEDSNTTRTGNYRKQAHQKKAGEMLHTLQKCKEIQQNNPKRNKCTETRLQKLLPDNFDKEEEGMKGESKQRNEPKKSSKTQRERLQQKEQVEASNETTKRPEETPDILQQPLQEQKPSTFTFTYCSEEKDKTTTHG